MCPKLGLRGALKPTNDWGVRVMGAACRCVVLREAVRALGLPLSPTREGLAIKPLVGYGPVQVLCGQLLPPVQAVVRDPVSPLVGVGGMDDRGLVGPELSRLLRETGC